MNPRPPRKLEWGIAILLVVAGVSAFVALQFFDWREIGKHPWYMVVLGLSIPILFGFCFRDLMNCVHQQVVWSRSRHLPEKIAFQQRDDGSWVGFVTTLDGEPKVVVLPDGYDPREDEGGREFFRQLGLPPDMLD